MQVKKTIKTKDKCSSKEVVVTVQRDCAKAIQECLLYLWSIKLNGKQLANWTLVGESKSGGILEIRPTSPKATMLSVQYSSRGKGCGLLYKTTVGNRGGGNGATPKRQTGISKRNDPLPETNGGIWGYTKLPV